MTGPEHYGEAERLLDAASSTLPANAVANALVAAQVHATLALAAATALQVGGREMSPADAEGWRKAAGKARRGVG